MKDYELRGIGEKITFNGEDYFIKDYGETVDYFVVKSLEDREGFYLDEYNLKNNRCIRKGLHVTYTYDNMTIEDYLEDDTIEEYTKEWLESFLCFDINGTRHGELLNFYKANC